MSEPPKKYVCAQCRKKYVSRIRPPIHLDGIQGKDIGCKVIRCGSFEMVSCSRTPGWKRFEGSEYACSVECYRELFGKDPPEETPDG